LETLVGLGGICLGPGLLAALANAAEVEKYSDRPLNFADARLLWLADALEVTDIAAFADGFRIYRTRRGRRLRNRFG
jgi:predicted nucleic acid-binding protein